MNEFLNSIKAGDYFTAAEIYQSTSDHSEMDKILKQYNCKTEVMLLIETSTEADFLDF